LSETVFLKLGGSLITDKTRDATAKPDVIRAMAREVRAALDEEPGLHLLVGHGSGSFGHFVAREYQVHRGCLDWWGYAATSAAASRLNRLVVDLFLEEGVPVVSLQPSASARCVKGELVELATAPTEGVLARGLVPMIFGDVSLDDVQGSAIASTEQIMAFLAPLLKPTRIVLAGEVDGVFTADPRRDPNATLVRRIGQANVESVRAALTGSHGVDVTGGMLTKVLIMAELARADPNLSVHLVSGLREGCVRNAILGRPCEAETVIRW
jgi:isopentenyl phosphate kinase